MTKPTPATKLVDAMLADEHFLDRVAEHHSATTKFQRVLNDEQVAGELALGDVARMIDLPVATLLMITEGSTPCEVPTAAEEPLPPGWPEHGSNARVLDLRPVFEAGFEPLMLILAEVATLGADDLLILEAPFHPKPLRRLLRGRGFDSFAREIPGGYWQVALRRAGAVPMATMSPGVSVM